VKGCCSVHNACAASAVREEFLGGQLGRGHANKQGGWVGYCRSGEEMCVKRVRKVESVLLPACL
jgi:hypothetical protein